MVRADSRSEPLTVVVTSGIGRGPTAIAAFDAALTQAGVADCNLIKLSSVIPPGSVIIDGSQVIAPPLPSCKWGDRLYVVLANCRVKTRNRGAWAGLGWWQDEHGRGVFVEHIGSTEEEVDADITESLDALLASRRAKLSLLSTETPTFHRMIVGDVCRDEAAICALVVAAYFAEGWKVS